MTELTVQLTGDETGRRSVSQVLFREMCAAAGASGRIC